MEVKLRLVVAGLQVVVHLRNVLSVSISMDGSDDSTLSATLGHRKFLMETLQYHFGLERRHRCTLSKGMEDIKYLNSVWETAQKHSYNSTAVAMGFAYTGYPTDRYSFGVWVMEDMDQLYNGGSQTTSTEHMVSFGD